MGGWAGGGPAGAASPAVVQAGDGPQVAGGGPGAMNREEEGERECEGERIRERERGRERGCKGREGDLREIEREERREREERE